MAAAAALVVVAAYGSAGVAAPTPAGTIRLGPLMRVQTPGGTPISCPFESEPEIAHTKAGTWIGYNDDTGCPWLGSAGASQFRLTGVTHIPAGGGASRYVDLPLDKRVLYYSGDPDLAVDPRGDGGVLLASMVGTPQGTQLAIVRIPPTGKATLLPNPSLGTSDDKEFLATDTSPRSRYRGHTYLVWDDFASGKITLRAFDGKRWLAAVTLADITGQPDVAVARNGDVAVAYSTDAGVAVRVSYDGGRSFDDRITVLKGTGPGRDDPSCPLRPTIAQRQRATKSPRVTWDDRGGLHVVASLGSPGTVGVATGSVGAGTGGQGTVLHAVSTDRGVSFSRQAPVGAVETAEVQWAPAIAALPGGGVAVSYLQTAETTSYDAFVAVQVPSSPRFRAPILLSEGHGPLPPATEGVGNSNCYGVGDYTGLAATPDGVVADWPTTVGVETSFLDSDIAVRRVHITR
ncbi:MAG: hypothetical protein JJD92_08460 [Frankiaceae bacterium]|nr:hypothetical protein [Frankiaceae bacterium]